MMLTLTIEQKDREPFDIQVPSGQKMEDTMRVLYENNLIGIEHDLKECVICSVRAHAQINPKYSYEENMIYTADILKIC